ncbi:hypothetical protein EV174_000971 [Coemansia sp. RSA 2320]|nr:hypothetical protein EV174_000971 [Coemansia sp. RSA 2320]
MTANVWFASILFLQPAHLANPIFASGETAAFLQSPSLASPQQSTASSSSVALLAITMAPTTQQQKPPPLPQQQPRTLWAIYKGIAPRHRIFLGMGFMAFSMLGIWASGKLEEAYPAPPDNRVTHISHGDTASVDSSRNL